MASHTVWKYDLFEHFRNTPGPIDQGIIDLPADAYLLDVQMQGHGPMLWAAVDPDRPLVPRRMVIVGTGQPIPGWADQYVGTFQANAGALVFHVFEQGPTWPEID